MNTQRKSTCTNNTYKKQTSKEANKDVDENESPATSARPRPGAGSIKPDVVDGSANKL